MSDKKIKFEISTSHKYLPANTTESVFLLIKIIQPKISMESERLPLNISFVLDRSGSMHGAKLDYTRKAVQFALRNLESTDRISLVTFDNRVEVPIPSIAAENTDQLQKLVEKIYSRGMTNLSGGLLEGVNQVQKNYRKDMVNRVILLTDGLANEGITDPARLKEMAADINSKGIGISALGVGNSFNEDLLVSLAETGNGNFYFIETPDSIPSIFAEELSGLLSVTAQNPTLKICPASGVRLRNIFGYNASSDDTTLINLPDIYNGETKTVMAELKVKIGSPGMMRLADVNFCYFDVTEDLAKVNNDMQVSLEATEDIQAVIKGFDMNVTKEIEIFRMTKVREEAIREADSGNFEKARNILLEKHAVLEEIFKQSGDMEIEECLKKIIEEIEYMAHWNYTPVSRKRMTNENFRQKRRMR